MASASGWIPLAVLVLLLAGVGVSALSTVDGVRLRAFEQHLYDATTEGMDTTTVAQSFRSPRAGLSRIELHLSSFSELPSTGRIWLLDGDGTEGAPVFEAPLSRASFDTNPYLAIKFPPIEASEGVTYTLLLETPGRPLYTSVGIRYSSFDALSSGRMYTDAGEQRGDLAISAYYVYTPASMWADAFTALGERQVLIASWALVLMLPGLALLLWLPNSLSGGQRLIAAPAVTALALPVFFLLTRALGLGMGGAAMWVLLVLCAGSILLWVMRHRGQISLGLPRVDVAEVGFWGLLGAVLLLTLAVRLVSLRDAVAGMGLDAYHHTLIAKLFMESGGIPSGYEPYAPLVSFTYHYGFHALIATVGWLSGMTSADDVLRLMPEAGQLATTLPVLTLTLFGWKALGNRWVGLAAGAMVGLASVFPAFYVNWSRYTQGLGLALLPVAWVLFTEAVDASRRPLSPSPQPSVLSPAQRVRQQSGPFMLAVIGATGLALSHYRIMMVFAGFVALYLLWRLFDGLLARKPLLEAAHPLLRAALVAALTLAALLPWLVNLRQNFGTRFVGKTSDVTRGYYSVENMIGGGLLAHPSLHALFALSLVALLVFGWQGISKGWKGLLAGFLAGIPALCAYWGIYAEGRLPLELALSVGVASVAGLGWAAGGRLTGLVLGALALLPALCLYVSRPAEAEPVPVAWLLVWQAISLGALMWTGKRSMNLLLLPALAWVVLGLLSNPHLLPLHLPYSGYLDATTLASSVWVPLSILAGFTLGQLALWLVSLGDGYDKLRQSVWRVVAPLLIGLIVLLGGASSGLALASMIDSKPYLAEADAEALAWMRDNLPRDSYVLANPFAFPWDPPPQAVHGSDAGLWVPLVTGGIGASVPPIPAYNERPREAGYVDRLRQLVTYAPFESQEANWQALRDAGVTHIYVGSRGGAFHLPTLLQTDHTDLLFHKDGVWLFELR